MSRRRLSSAASQNTLGVNNALILPSSREMTWHNRIAIITWQPAADVTFVVRKLDWFYCRGEKISQADNSTLSQLTQYGITQKTPCTKLNKKAQLSLTNPRDAKACQNCSNSTCLQRFRWQYWPIFMRLTAIASEIREIQRNSLKIQTYGVQGHPRSSTWVPIESPYVTCY